jgi:hypothetical protein
MNSSPASAAPAVELGMAGLIMGTVAVLLAIFPVLGIPLASVGLICASIGFLLALRRGGLELRWSAGGIVMCAAALAVSLAIQFAPLGYLRNWDVPQLWREVPDRPYVPQPSP